ncbi:MAG: TCR/Tet family MFS transporter [Proteobacteria bacterium]|nr:TCR/Tet family MFS transporter [Pseudomonadota bacterium]
MMKTPALYFILTTVVLDAVGIGIIWPVLPDLIREIGGVDLPRAALWGGVLGSAYAVMQFLFSPAIGNLSDRFGRRPVLFITLFIMAVDYCIMGLTHSIWVLLLGRIIGGIVGATIPTAMAYMADISKGSARSVNFGLIGAAFGIGFILGPMLGGVFASFGLRVPFFMAAVLTAGNLVFGVFCLPETLKPANRRKLELSRLNPFGAFAAVARISGLGMLMVVLFFNQIAGLSYPTIWAFYTIERYGWQSFQVGLSLAGVGVAIGIGQGWLIRHAIAILGEWRTVVVGFCVASVTFCLYGVATQGWMAYAILPILGVSVIAHPALNGVVSQAVSDDAQGELQGVIASITAVAAIISPLVMSGVFSFFIREGAPIYLPGAPFFLAAGLQIITLVIFVRVMWVRKI